LARVAGTNAEPDRADATSYGGIAPAIAGTRAKY
jgi:hypothetical protein